MRSRTKTSPSDRTSDPRDGGTRTRHVPQRTCVGCRETGDQSLFVRVVRRPDGAVEVDEGRRRAPGRGAYLHRDRVCWDRALRPPRAILSRALRATIDAGNREALLAFGGQFSHAAGDAAGGETTDHGAAGSDADAAPRAASPAGDAGRKEPDA